MRRRLSTRLACLGLAISFATAGGLLAVQPTDAAPRGRARVRGYRDVHRFERGFRPRHRYYGPRAVRRYYDDDDRGFSIGNAFIGAALGYGAYRAYDHFRGGRRYSDDDDGGRRRYYSDDDDD